jgi:UDP-N-acetyl-D-glucosamine dehydrogenase
VLISTDHSAFDYPFIVRHSRLVVDTRNATKAVTEGREKIRRA